MKRLEHIQEELEEKRATVSLAGLMLPQCSQGFKVRRDRYFATVVLGCARCGSLKLERKLDLAVVQIEKMCKASWKAIPDGIPI